MPPVPRLQTIVPLTELQAVNYMLRQIGEAPIAQAELDTVSREDVQVAIDVLRQTLAKVLSHGWLFNTDFEYRIAGDVDEEEEFLGTFSVPSNLLKFDTSLRHDQMGVVPEKNADGTFTTTPTVLDLVVRKDEDDDALKFYDRIQNTFIFGDVTTRQQIFIDAVWFMDFDGCPETLRQYVSILSAMEFVKTQLEGEQNLGPTTQDMRIALKLLNEEQGNPVRYHSIFDHQDVRRHLGQRPFAGVPFSGPTFRA
jgi:hypothetical protein